MKLYVISRIGVAVSVSEVARGMRLFRIPRVAAVDATRLQFRAQKVLRPLLLPKGASDDKRREK